MYMIANDVKKGDKGKVGITPTKLACYCYYLLKWFKAPVIVYCTDRSKAVLRFGSLLVMKSVSVLFHVLCVKMIFN